MIGQNNSSLKKERKLMTVCVRSEMGIGRVIERANGYEKDRDENKEKEERETIKVLE